MTKQARAVTVRPEETRNRFIAVLAALGVAIALLWSAAANAQDGAPQGEDPPGMDGDGVTPPPEDGVITPPDVGDDEINQPAPDPDPGTTPVVPPEAVPEQQPEE